MFRKEKVRVNTNLETIKGVESIKSNTKSQLITLLLLGYTQRNLLLKAFPSSTLAKYFDQLNDESLIKYVKKGKNIIYHINKEKLTEQIFNSFISQLKTTKKELDIFYSKIITSEVIKNYFPKKNNKLTLDLKQITKEKTVIKKLPLIITKYLDELDTFLNQLINDKDIYLLEKRNEWFINLLKKHLNINYPYMILKQDITNKSVKEQKDKETEEKRKREDILSNLPSDFSIFKVILDLFEQAKENNLIDLPNTKKYNDEFKQLATNYLRYSNPLTYIRTKLINEQDEQFLKEQITLLERLYEESIQELHEEHLKFS